MEYDEIEAFLDAEREKRKTDREREIEQELQRITTKHRDAMAAECKPLYDELTQIEAMKSPMPVVMNGKIYRYVEPRS